MPVVPNPGTPAVAPFNTAAVNELFSAIVTDAQTLGVFETVNKHEPKMPPGNGLCCSVWVSTIKPVRTSGLSQTSGLVSFFIRIYNSMLAEPQDDIDPAILSAACSLMESYSGDFLFEQVTSAEVRNVDLLGAYGEGLGAQAGYMEIGNKMFRVMVITLPVIVNDLWPQEA